MVLQQYIEQQLTDVFDPVSLQLVNASDGHNVPPGSETHFNLVIASEQFVGLSCVQRQQRVYQVLDEAFSRGLHALSMSTLTPAEWQQECQQQPLTPQSPPCLGGGKEVATKQTPGVGKE